jgi:RHS repeat-associated protein
MDLESARTAAGYLVSIKADSNALEYTFGDANRIQRIVRTNGAGLDIVYDGRGFMARADLTKKDPPYGHVDVWTQSTYDSDGVLRTLQRRTIAGGAIDVTNILYFSGLPIAQWKKSGASDPTTTWVIPDHLGTPAATLTSAGTLDWFGGFEPFGADWQKGGAQDSITKGVFLRMPGQWTDSIWDIPTNGIQLHYNLNRWYEQQSGRYLQVDPMGLHTAGGLHPLNLLFGYSEEDPLAKSDPLGLYATVGCNSTQASAIGIAWNQATDALRGAGGRSKCLKCVDPAPIIRKMASTTYHCLGALSQGALGVPENMCQWAGDPDRNITGSDVTVFDHGFQDQQENQCGCLKSSLLHEALHQTPVCGDSEGCAGDKAKECFGCARNP